MIKRATAKIGKNKGWARLFIVSLLVVLGSTMLAPMALVGAQPIDANTGAAPAPTNRGTFYTLSIDQQAKVFSSLRAALSKQCSFAGETQDQITSGNWFSASDTVKVGHHVEPDDGVVGCRNENKWFSSLLDGAGYANDYITPAKAVFGTSNFTGALNNNNSTTWNNLTKLFQNAYFNGSAIPTTAPDYLEYTIYYDNFVASKACNGSEAPPVSNANARSQLTQSGKVITPIYVYDQTTNTVIQKDYVYDDPTRGISTGYGLDDGGDSDATLECKTIASHLANSKYAQAVLAYVAANAQTAGSITSDPSNSGILDTNAQCEDTIAALGWIICPIIIGASKAVDGIYSGLIHPLLVTQPLSLSTGKNNPDYGVWSSFRVIGDVFLVIALLVIVFGQSLGGGMIDAYSAKKILPRLLAAAILINLSYYIVALAVDVSNILGSGIQQLIIAPFNASGMHIKVGAGADTIADTFTVAGVVAACFAAVSAGSVGAAAAATGAAIVGLTDFLGFFLLFVLVPALLVLISIVAVLLLRQGLILLLVLLSPVAFALYCLPNTEHYFKKWWDLLYKTLLVYPIVAVLFALSKVFAYTITNSPGSGAYGVLKPLFALIALLVPLFLVPFAFKLAGGVLGRFHEIMSGGGKRGLEAIKGNPNDPTSLRNRTKRNAGQAFTRRQAKITDAGRALGASRRARVFGGIVDQFGNVDQRLSTYNAQEREMAEKMSATGRDSLRYAGAGYKVAAGTADRNGVIDSSDRYFNSKGAEISSNMFRRGKQLYGAGAGGFGQSLEYTYRKAQTPEDLANARYAFAQNAIENNWDDNEAMDVWAAGTFAHKDKWKSEWYSTPSVVRNAGGRTQGVTFADVNSPTPAGAVSRRKMLSEYHRVPESFKLSTARAEDWQAIGTTLRDTQSRIISGTATPADLVDFALSSEILDSASSRGMFTQTDDGEVQVNGPSSAGQDVITATVKSRKLATAPVETSPGQFSDNLRAIYDSAAVKAASTPTYSPTGARIAPTMTKDQAIAAHTIASAQVMDDRSNIPTVVT